MDVGLGLGIGLQQKEGTARDLWQARRQDDLYKLQLRQKEQANKDESFAKASEDFTIKEPVHRLLRGEYTGVAQDAVNKLLEAKRSGNPNWQNKISEITQEYNNRMINLRSLNKNYWDFEAQTKTYDPGTQYTTKNARSLMHAFANAKDRFDLIEHTQKNGFQNDHKAGLLDDGFLAVKLPDKINTDQIIASTAKAIPASIITSSHTPKPGGGFEIRSTEFVPANTQEAMDYYKSADPTTRKRLEGFGVDPQTGIPNIPTIEGVVEQRMQDADFVEQYADRYGLQTTEQVKHQLFADIARQVKTSDKTSYKEPQKEHNINVSVNTGGEKSSLVTPTIGHDVFEIRGKQFHSFAQSNPDVLLKSTPDSVNMTNPEGTQFKGQMIKPILSRLFVSPYKEEMRAGVKVKIPVKAGEAMTGIDVFAQIQDPSQSSVAFIPADLMSFDNTIAGDKGERNQVIENYTQMKRRKEVLNKRLSNSGGSVLNPELIKTLTD